MKRMGWMTVVLTAYAVAPLAGQQEDFRWVGRIAAGDEIEIKGVNGGIRATIADGDEVEVVAFMRARRSDPDEITFDVVEHGDGVTVCAVYPSRRGRPNECAPGSRGRMNTRNNDVRVRFEVRVPRGVVLVARTVNGDVDGRGLQSDVEAHTVNGDVDVETSGTAVAETVNGSIYADLGRAPGDEARFETVNGSVTVSFPEGLSADLEASTVNGSIESDFPIALRGRLTRRSLRGEIGEGGPLLEVRTVNGSIRLRVR